MWVVGQVVGLELLVRWVVVRRLVGFSWLFDGGSFGFRTLFDGGFGDLVFFFFPCCD